MKTLTWAPGHPGLSLLLLRDTFLTIDIGKSALWEFFFCRNFEKMRKNDEETATDLLWNEKKKENENSF